MFSEAGMTWDNMLGFFSFFFFSIGVFFKEYLIFVLISAAHSVDASSGWLSLLLTDRLVYLKFFIHL